MKKAKLTLNFENEPQLLEMLRFAALQEGETQKSIVVRALEAYFSHRFESSFIAKNAEKMFAEWDNEEDEIYDSL